MLLRVVPLVVTLVPAPVETAWFSLLPPPLRVFAPVAVMVGNRAP